MGIFSFLSDFHEVIGLALFIFKNPLPTTQHSASPTIHPEHSLLEIWDAKPACANRREDKCDGCQILCQGTLSS